MDNKNDQERITEEYNENAQQMITEEPNEKGPHTLTSPAEDMEFSQDSNTGSENGTSSCLRTNQDKEDYSETEELRKQATGE